MKKRKWKSVDDYCKSISRCLVCSKEEKEIILNGVKADIADFCATNPKATVEVIASHFGEPADFMYEYLIAINKEELLKKIEHRRLIRSWLIIIGCIIGILALVACVWMIREHAHNIIYSSSVSVSNVALLENVTGVLAS